MPTNWMRTGAFQSWSPMGPYLQYKYAKINDGQIIGDFEQRTNDAYLYTNDMQSHYNLGVGCDILFSELLTMRSFRMHAFIKPVTEITIEYYADSALLLKYVRPISRVERRLAVNWFTYNVPNAPSANRVKVYISGWDGVQNDYDLYQGLLWNYYAFELEAYTELFLTDVLATWNGDDWLAPFAFLTYKNGEWVRDGMPMSYHDEDWHEFV